MLFDPGGTARYIRALTTRWTQLPGIDVVEVNMASSWPWVLRLSRSARIRIHDLFWITVGVERAARRVDADVLHGPAFRVPTTSRIPTVVTIHDDTPWDDPPSASRWTRNSLRRTVRKAEATLSLAVVSNQRVATAVLDVVPALKGRVRVTPFGVDHGLFAPAPADQIEDCLRLLDLRSPYVLVVGPYGPRKNFSRMLEALARADGARREITLAVVGRSPTPVRPAGLPVRYLGSISDADLARVYSGAEFLFYASLKEGFGFPVLEAMACGCPVLASRRTVLEELANGAAALADPRDIGALVRACCELLDRPELREQLSHAGLARAARVTWDEAITTTAAAWREAVDNDRRDERSAASHGLQRVQLPAARIRRQILDDSPKLRRDPRVR